MKATVNLPVEINITGIQMVLAVRYEEDDIPNDFPGRSGEILKMDVEIDTGKILDWPEGKDFDLFMKVTDCGTYTLFDSDGKRVKTLTNDYVPHGVVPGEYGDYVKFDIKNGIITNWPKNPDLKDFFPED